jgi:AcrR family transcriptional regulator
MARTVGSKAESTLKAIRQAGVRLMYEHGFEAMSLRQLAAVVGIQPGSLYNHFKTKQELLDLILREHMEQLIAACEAELATVPEQSHSTVERLRVFADFHVRYYAQKRMDVFVANMELRALQPAKYKEIVAMRSAYEMILVGILDEGIASGQFARRDAKVTAYGIIAMLTNVCMWYRKNGRLKLDELAQTYVDMVLASVSVNTTAATQGAA